MYIYAQAGATQVLKACLVDNMDPRTWYLDTQFFGCYETPVAVPTLCALRWPDSILCTDFPHLANADGQELGWTSRDHHVHADCRSTVQLSQLT
jgi:hypothetical protein